MMQQAHEPCSVTKCGKNEIPIRFPFQLEGKLPENCGYPGFNLGCKSQSSPFLAVFHQNYTFLNCPTQVTESRFTTIDCLSNSTNSVLATSSMSLVNSMASSCQIITTLPIPVSWPAQYDEEFSVDLDDDIQLTWYTPECGDCEAEGGICGFKSNSNEEIDCFHLPKSGRSGNGLQVFRIICLSIAVPGLSCAIGIAVFACCMDSRRRARENSTHRSTGPSAVLPQPTLVVTGLDESTIESYQKLVLGESRRIPGPNDSTCPICLSEYLSKDTIRCIPECKHCFHAECIDEWLRMNTTCPVCRNSPSAEDASSHTDIV